MTKPARIFWTDEKLLKAAINELLAHGGNEADVSLLREQFQSVNKTNNPDQPAQTEITGDIPA